ncbi:MAG: hypothetical protein PUB34_03125 [Clostridia bacterium]|nr:hypothetical protein [Clostridia bacterium]
MKKNLLNPFLLFLVGLALGVISRIFDIYFDTLGNIFSQMAVWILLGTVISIFSRTKKNAMLNIFPFCIGMLITYYLTSAVTDGVYGKAFIIGWTVFVFCSPILAYFAWLSKEDGLFPKLISVGIVAVSVLSSILLFDRLRFYDLIIDSLLIYFLFFKKVKRGKIN